MTQFILALFLIGIGLSIAGTGTHLYQQIARKVAAFRVEGRNGFEHIVSVFIVVLCGPYLMLRMGMQLDAQGRVSAINILLAATIAFGWSFVTGLMVVGTYVSVARIV